jgi:sulfofructosephosphate aldolase
MTTAFAKPDLSALARPSGAFAMLAVDQREAMRAMFAEHQSEPVSDEQVTGFKLAATRTLTPYASAVLLDKQFVLDRAIAERAVAPGCALIAAADEFIPSAEELVADVRIDAAVDPAYYRDRGVQALKLLVIYRPDGDPSPRISMVEEFVDRCRSNGLISIIEPVSRAPLTESDWDWNSGVLAAARELGVLGADLYKAEMPLRGEGSDDEVRAACAAITETVATPWVVLSSGVHRDRFARAVALACAEGASGFLAGRAVWSACIGAPDPLQALRQDAVGRLQLLCETVDDAVTGRR